jgi:hypothetical protein
VSGDARGANERVFRAANEAIQHNREPRADELLTFLCECSAVDCTTDVGLTLAEYRSLRANERHFAVSGGHEDRSIERVVDEFDRYTIVAK